MADVTIRVTEDPNRVEVGYLGRTHAGAWDDEGGVEPDGGSDPGILAAALCAWDGSDEMSLTGAELEALGGGHWARPA